MENTRTVAEIQAKYKGKLARYFFDFVQKHTQRDPTTQQALEREFPHLLDTADWLREQEQWPDLLVFIDALWEKSGFLQDRGSSLDAVPLLEASLEAAQVLDEIPTICTRLNDLGETWRTLGQIDQAIALHEKSLNLARQQRDTTATRAALCYLGMAWIDKDISNVLPYLNQALEIADLSPSSPLDIDVFSALATVYAQLAQVEQAPAHFEQASDYLEQAIHLAQTLQDSRRLANLYHQRGYLRAVLGAYPDAQADFGEAQSLSETLHHAFGQARAAQALGVLDLQTGQVEQGVSDLKNAIRLFEQTGDSAMIPATSVALAQGYMALGQMDMARERLEYALETIVAYRAFPTVAALEAPVRQLLDSMKLSDTE
jgi:tetratricopeptide (TPR) repeat protein